MTTTQAAAGLDPDAPHARVEHDTRRRLAHYLDDPVKDDAENRRVLPACQRD